MKYMRKLIASALVLAMLLVPVLSFSPASALFDNAKGDACNGIDLGTSATCANGAGGVQTILKNSLNIMSVIVGVVAVIMIIIGGLKYITSGGDASKAASGRTTLTYAIIGLVIVALAQVIVQFVISKTS